MNPTELALLAGLSTRRGSASADDLFALMERSGVDAAAAQKAVVDLLARDALEFVDAGFAITMRGSASLLEACAEIERALDNSPTSASQEECPSIPWLTQVQTEWVDAVSLNYAVQPDAVAALLPSPLEPEIFEGTAWVQVLLSSLRDMRPQGLASLFGVNFYQVSYRAAVRYRDAHGQWRRGGYFVRSETNHAVMQAVGNALVEFKFHDFGAAQMYLVRDGERLTAAVDAERPGGKIVGVFNTQPLAGPPTGSVWRDLEHLQYPLVECYDAFGVDPEERFMHTLTIDRAPWNARFVEPVELYCEYVDTGALGGGVARLDSTLHIPRCAYRWRPLRRAPLP